MNRVGMLADEHLREYRDKFLQAPLRNGKQPVLTGGGFDRIRSSFPDHCYTF
jgi:hypothetical protein